MKEWDLTGKSDNSEDEPQSQERPFPKTLFDMGQIVITPGAIAGLSLVERHPVQLLARHVTGDWGSLDKHDVKENELSLRKGYRLFSAYNIEDQRFYVITEHDRSATTVLLPEEY